MEKSSDLLRKGKKDNETRKKKQRGFLSRLWHRMFRDDTIEKRLQRISKEENAILNRMKERSQRWRMIARHLILFTVILEAIAIGYAIVTTRLVVLNWKLRAFRVLPMFLLPALSSITYSGISRFTKMCDEKNKQTLERLRAERKAKIDELKEKTNYYTTQQLIQRYDTDPAAKAAAAAVLASKLSADSGLKVQFGDENELNNHLSSSQSNDVEFVQSNGLRNRKSPPYKSDSTESSTMLQQNHKDCVTQNQRVVEHYSGNTKYNNGWIAQIAALLVGDDPSQCYALICGNCHMHNGLAMKEDYPYITYYCPHCHALNKPKRNNGLPGNVGGSIVHKERIHVSGDASSASAETVPEMERVGSIDQPTGPQQVRASCFSS